MTRLEACFAKLKTERRAGLAIFTTACDPSYEESAAALHTLLAAGVDLIEIGMPFSDPMAEGAAIQASSARALAAGATMKKTFSLVKTARAQNQSTPIILMGYYNPILAYGIEAWAKDAALAGADGVIVVDAPPEEDELLFRAANADGRGLVVVRLIAPTSEKRLPFLLARAAGFLYYVSITGTTGAARPNFATLADSFTKLRQATALPIALGFGIKTPQDTHAAAQLADIVVIGSAFVELLAQGGDITTFIRAHQEALAGVKK